MHGILVLRQPNSKPSQTKSGRKRKNRPQLQAATKRNRAMIPLLETTAAVATPACRAATANRKQNRSSSAVEILLPKLATNSKSKGKESKGKERGGGGIRRNFGRILAHVISKESAEGQQQE